MLRLFTDTAILALRRTARSWLAALSIPIYTIVFLLTAVPLLRIPEPIGSILVSLLASALCAGYLSLLGASVSGEPIRWADLRNGMRAIWDVVSVFFIIWLVRYFILGPIERGAGPNAMVIEGLVQLAIAIFLNAVPEVLYNGRGRSLAAIKESASFVMENPVGWFAPNVVLALVFFWATGALAFSSTGDLVMRLAALASAQGVLTIIANTAYWKIPLLIVFVHYAMVFRGLLYRELGTSSTRMRDFRRRMGN